MLAATVLFGGAGYLTKSGDAGFLNWILGFLVIGAAALLLIGFLTTPVALMMFAGGVLSLVFVQTSITLEIYAAVLASAIVLLGPGAFSLDARLFGRREIVIPKNGRNQ